ncbi:MAG: hypothetical protein Kow00128_09940 [Deltaproteobacteria bacterium]
MKKARPARKTGGTALALRRALKFEQDGKRLFSTAAKRSADPFAKQVFELLAQMEAKHCEDILAIAKALEETGAFPKVSDAPTDARMKMFQKEYRRIRKEKTISGDAADAMRKALAFEALGREMYDRLSKAATHPQEKKFFRLLSGEENSHFNIIFEYLDFMEDRGLRMQDG